MYENLTLKRKLSFLFYIEMTRKEDIEINTKHIIVTGISITGRCRTGQSIPVMLLEIVKK